jgi:L-iditol 2-dehydrogenase
MRAARLYAARDLRVEDIPAPELSPGKVLVRIRAAGICGSDVHLYQDGRIGDVKLDGPLIPGHEMAGEVALVGDGVRNIKPEIKVAIDPSQPCGVCEFCRTGHYNVCPDMIYAGIPPTDGGFCEYMALPPSCLYPIPDRFTYGEGVMIETMAVGLHAVDLAHVKTGDTAVVFGMGPVGQTILQCLRVAGAQEIFAVDPIQHRIDTALLHGATAGINPTREDPVASVRKLTRGRGVDVAIEAAGEPETPGQCVETARPGGRVVLVGIPTDDTTTFKAGSARRKGLTIYVTRRMRHTYRRCIDLVDRGVVDLRSLVTHAVPLDDLQNTITMVEERANQVIKAIIVFRGNIGNDLSSLIQKREVMEL